MSLYKYNGELLPERRGIIGAVLKTVGRGRLLRRARRFERIVARKLLQKLALLAAISLTCFAVLGIKFIFHGAEARK